MEGSSQHGEWGAARAVPPEDGVGEGEPPRRGGHERAHEHPLHGAAALREERRCARASRRWYPRRRRVPAGMGGGGGGVSGGPETRADRRGEVGFWGCVGARAAVKEAEVGERFPSHTFLVVVRTLPVAVALVGPLVSRAHGPWALALAGPANGLCSQF